MKSILACRAFLLLVSGCVLLATAPAIAKRSAPRPAKPVTANGVEYSAPQQFMAFVLATDAHSHAELWRERIYSVNIDPMLERDVQDVFITSLAIDGENLVVANERNDIYVLDLVTRTVTQRR
jgi:hypothetical protein